MKKILSRLTIVLAITAMTQGCFAALAPPGSGSGDREGIFPPIADETTYSDLFGGDINGAYAAIIKSVTGGRVDVTGNTARITANDMVTFINWLKMNLPAGKTLDYYFMHDGQFAINTVETGMSRFAGTIQSSGAKGRIIISNPNGVLMEGSSVVNANSLLLTTHGVSVDGAGNVTLTAQAGEDGNYYGITVLSGAKMTLADDLTIIANGIDVAGANITAGNNINFYTTDGATYVAGAVSNVSNTAINPNAVKYGTLSGTRDGDAVSIKIANTSFKTTDGKIYLTSRNEPAGIHTMEMKIPGSEGTYGDISLTNVTADGSVAADSANSVKITNGAYKGNLSIAAAGNVDLTSTNALTNVALCKDLEINAGQDVSLINVRINDAAQKATISGNNVTIQSHGLNSWAWDNSILGDTNITARGDINIYQTQIRNNLVANAGGNINFGGALVTKDATLRATNINITESPVAADSGYIPRIWGNLDAVATEKITLRNNYPNIIINELPTAIRLAAKEIEIENFGFKSANIDAGKATLIDTLVQNDLGISNFDTLTVSGMRLGGNLTLTNGAQANITGATIGGSAVLTNVADTTASDSVIAKDLSVSYFNSFTAHNVKVDGITSFYNGEPEKLTVNPNPLNSAQSGEASTFVNRLATGDMPNIENIQTSFSPRAFAAEDQSSYKEEFLRKHVQAPNGNIMTTQLFKAE